MMTREENIRAYAENPAGEIAKIMDQKVCEHIYGYDDDYDLGGLLKYEKINNADIIFTYCPICGKRLV